MFLHYLLKRKKDELIYQVFEAQKDDPVKNDWFSQVCLDLKDFGMDYLELDEIKNMSKYKFKKILREKCRDASLKYLLENKRTNQK